MSCWWGHRSIRNLFTDVGIQHGIGKMEDNAWLSYKINTEKKLNIALQYNSPIEFYHTINQNEKKTCIHVCVHTYTKKNRHKKL